LPESFSDQVPSLWLFSAAPSAPISEIGFHTRGLLRRMEVKGHCIGKEVSRFEQDTNDFIENIDDECFYYDGERVARRRLAGVIVSGRG
jgi:hypothetical protein